MIREYFKRFHEIDNEMYHTFRIWCKVHQLPTNTFDSYRLNGVSYEESNSIIFKRDGEMFVIPLYIAEIEGLTDRENAITKLFYQNSIVDLENEIKELGDRINEAHGSIMWYEEQLEKFNDTV